jgi:hypothetical protein
MKNWTQTVSLATLDSKSLNQHATFLVPSPPTLLIQLIAPLVIQHASHAQVHYQQIVFLVLIQPTSILPPHPVSLLASTAISPILKKEYVKAVQITVLLAATDILVLLVREITEYLKICADAPVAPKWILIRLIVLPVTTNAVNVLFQ